ncbi:hypothetical protein [Kibdelosporangium aridum]|uniref:hypothetical protein n=1 Tax=Kibdelosporangium aridum TaxID=2030 RepID=UPI00117A4DCE|nr:hypothetical protein [Kibdelosporangium aridum]
MPTPVRLTVGDRVHHVGLELDHPVARIEPLGPDFTNAVRMDILLDHVLKVLVFVHLVVRTLHWRPRPSLNALRKRLGLICHLLIHTVLDRAFSRNLGEDPRPQWLAIDLLIDVMLNLRLHLTTGVRLPPHVDAVRVAAVGRRVISRLNIGIVFWLRVLRRHDYQLPGNFGSTF